MNAKLNGYLTFLLVANMVGEFSFTAIKHSNSSEKHKEVSELCYRTRTCLAGAFSTWDFDLTHSELSDIFDAGQKMRGEIVPISTVPIWEDFGSAVLSQLSEFNSHIVNEKRSKLARALIKNVEAMSAIILALKLNRSGCKYAFNVKKTYLQIVEAAHLNTLGTEKVQ